MAELVHVGCADLPQNFGWDRYFRKLSFLESSVLTRSPARPSVLAKWRAAAPGAGSFALVAPALTTSPLGVERGLDAYLEAARLLDASALVFRTPASFSPSAGNRDLIRRLFSEVVAPGPFARVWHPDGLWDTRTALKLATELGVILACDPLVRDPVKEPIDFFSSLDVPEVYFRVSGLGRGSRVLSASQLDELTEITSVYERAWVVFATVDAIADATRFSRMIGAQRPRADGSPVDDEE